MLGNYWSSTGGVMCDGEVVVMVWKCLDCKSSNVRRGARYYG